ncbi:MAG TPA: dockerin type I domain-containing protein [Bacillota bacterium]|nr:dockerin type I domain-containing protein [Bacillota bacterium]
MKRWYLLLLLCMIILGIIIQGMIIPVIVTAATITDADLNKDGIVNMQDVTLITAIFDSIRGDSRFKDNCDINQDGAVNLADVMLVGNYFGMNVPTTTPTPIPGNTKDKFGITMFNSTITNGREWFCKWDQGTERHYTWGYDALDPELVFRGSGDYTIYGSSGTHAGQMRLAGGVPRVYVRDYLGEDTPPPGTRTWNNVEVTFYAMTTSTGSNTSYAGIEAVVKTNHVPDTDLCGTRGYGGRMLFDGRMDFEKERCHSKEDIRTTPVYNWQDQGRMPLNTWIGYKYVARNCDNNTKVKLELYRDMTDGQNGGAWELMLTFTDYDGWSAGVSCCAAHDGKPLLEPNWSVYLRTDGLGEQFYKKFSIREVPPLP